MSTGLLLINSPNIDVKIVNRLLLHVRDWVFIGPPDWDRQHILFNRDDANLATVKSRDYPDEEVLGATVPPLQSPLPENQWSGLSIAEVEKLLLLKKCGMFLLLDDEGIRTQTLIVAEQVIDSDRDGVVYLPEYNKVRVPWEGIHAMWSNLDITNMGFQDFCVEDESPKDNGYWWTYNGLGLDQGDHEAVIEKRDNVIKELEKLDLA